MVNPQVILNGIADVVTSETAVTAVLTRELDLQGTDSSLSSPFGELQLISEDRIRAFNTDFIDYVLDDSGNRIGRLYEAEFDSELQLDVYVAAGSDAHDATTLGYRLQRTLRQYDSQERADPLPDASGSPIEDVVGFRVGDGTRADDLSGRGIRRWRQTLRVRFVDVIDTTVEYGEMDYVATVDTAHAGDMTGGDGDDVLIEYHPP